jgi:CRISPR-associated endonuclease Cas2
MPQFLVTYDLVDNEASSEYKRLEEAIKGYEASVKVQRSVWLVKAGSSAKELREELWRYMDRNDRLLVIRIARGSAWKNALSGNPEVKAFFAS